VSRSFVSSADGKYEPAPAAVAAAESPAGVLVSSEVALLEDMEDGASRRTGDVAVYTYCSAPSAGPQP
jgi:hypothetical protein